MLIKVQLNMSFLEGNSIRLLSVTFNSAIPLLDSTQMGKNKKRTKDIHYSIFWKLPKNTSAEEDWLGELL